jgi:4'-phosphopantetheinyl transferase
MQLDLRTAVGAPAEPQPAEPQRLLALASGVELWACGLAPTAEALASGARVLAPAERERAARFGTPLLRDRYIAGRAALRQLLGARLAVPPGAVDIRRGLRGRPYAEGASGLDFNISHTGAFAVIGMTTSGRIGVDVEHEGRQLNVAGVARKFMTTGEQIRLQALEPEERRRTLLQLWTCKEAMSKATGDALSAPFRQMDVMLDVSGARLMAGPGQYEPGPWVLHVMQAPGGHLATIALWKEE